LGRTRNALIYAIPGRWRGRVVAAMPERLVPPEMRPGYFNHLFDEGDPFGFDDHPVEQLKFDRTLEVCEPNVRGRVLEIGCAAGSFSEHLASRAVDVLALDVSPAAVEQAAQRLRNRPNVRTAAMSIAERFPEGTFDLIVASDVLYYLSVEDVERTLRRIENGLAETGAFVTVHYVPRMGALLNGDEVHDLLRAHTTLRHVFGERVEFGPGRPYRVDRYEKA
jgi:cyclopropane fatty-acyl-phospholipid synthase-like methyltransferase